MMEKYGQDSFALLVDEGSEYPDAHLNGSMVHRCHVGVYRDMGAPSSLYILGITVKGLLDTRVKVSTSGGHSSVSACAHGQRHGFSPILYFIEYRDPVTSPR